MRRPLLLALCPWPEDEDDHEDEAEVFPFFPHCLVTVAEGRKHLLVSRRCKFLSPGSGHEPWKDL